MQQKYKIAGTQLVKILDERMKYFSESHRESKEDPKSMIVVVAPYGTLHNKLDDDLQSKCHLNSWHAVMGQ